MPTNPNGDGVIRIQLRVTPEQRELLRRAAQVTGTSMSTFVLNSACRVAEQMLANQAFPSEQKEPKAQTRAAMEEARMMMRAA